MGAAQDSVHHPCPPPTRRLGPRRVTERAGCSQEQVRCLLCLCPQVLTCPNASFTDLAEIVSRIEPAKVAAGDGELDPETYTPNSWGWWWQRPLLTLTLNKLPWAPGSLQQPLGLVGAQWDPCLCVARPCSQEVTHTALLSAQMSLTTRLSARRCCWAAPGTRTLTSRVPQPTRAPTR